MVTLTRLNNSEMIINAELIEVIEETPDTVITLTTGRKFIVRESGQEVKNLVISYKRSLYKFDEN
ncbi:MAG: flagellar FlbD family protein [Lachnospiraceae bacterium]|nr:flagellar protein FlbD [Lachnospira sp.]MBQ8730545.1 flagellar FlbD family protein [Lachnospiraceae bacterium]